MKKEEGTLESESSEGDQTEDGKIEHQMWAMSQLFSARRVGKGQPLLSMASIK